MAEKGVPGVLLILALVVVLGVFLGNQWIASEVEEAGQLLPSSVSVVSSPPLRKNIFLFKKKEPQKIENRLLVKKESIEPEPEETLQEKDRKQRIIYEKPLDTKDLVQ